MKDLRLFFIFKSSAEMTVSMELHAPQCQFEPIHPGTEVFLYQRRNQLRTSVKKFELFR